MATGGAIRAGRAFVELFADDSKLVRGLKRAQRKLRAFGGNVRAIGVKMAAVGAAVVVPLLAAGRAFGSFEDQMKMVSTMLNEPEKYMKAFSQGIRKLSVEFGEGTDSLAKGMYDLLSASVDPAKALEVLGIAAKAARGGMTTTAIAVDGLTSVLNAFQMSAEEAGQVADVMFQTVKRGKLTFPDLAANIGKVAPMARAAGMSMQDMMASIASMTRQGLSAEEATTRLVNVLKDAPEQVGNIAALVGKYVGKSLTEIQLDFSSIRSAGGIAALAADMPGFIRDLELMQNATGQADTAFEKMSDGLSLAEQQMRKATTYLAVAIGKALGPTLKAAYEWIKKAVVQMGDWISKNQKVVVTILKVAVATVAVGAALVVLGTVIAGIASGMGLFLIAIAGAHAAMGLLLTVFAAIASPIWLLNASLVALGVVLLHVTGDGAAVLAWFAEKFGALKADALSAFQGISDALVSGDIASATKILWLTIKMEWDTGINALQNAWLFFQTFLVSTYHNTWDSLLAASESGWHALEKEWIETQGFFSRTWIKMSGAIGKPLGIMETSAKKSWNIIKGIFDESLDVKAENVTVENEAQAAIVGRKDQQERDLTQQQKKQQSALEAAATVHEGTMAVIGKQNLDKLAELDAEYANKMAQNATDLAGARKAWQDAIAAVKSKREDWAGWPSAPDADSATGLEGVMTKIRAGLSGLDDMMTTARERTIGVTGTFNAASLLGLQAGGADDRIANATERTAEEVIRLQSVVKANVNTYD